MCNIKFYFLVLYLQITSFCNLECSNDNLQENNTKLFLDDSELDRYKLFVNTINEIKTMGDVQVIFTESDLNKIFNIDCYDEKDEVIVKFQTKIECLLCTYSLIVKYMLYHLKSLSKSKMSDDVMLLENSVSNNITEEVEEMKIIQSKNNNKAKRVTFADKTRCINLDKLYAHAIFRTEMPEEYNEDLEVLKKLNRENKHPIKHQNIIELFTENVQKMLSVLYTGKIVAPDWLWIFSIKLNAVNVRQMTVDEFCDEKLEISIHDHSKHCMDHNILEPIELMEVQFTSKNSEKYIRNLLMELLYESSDGLVKIYRYNVQFNIYTFFWTRHDNSKNIPFNIVPSRRHFPWYDILRSSQYSYYVAALSVCIGNIGKTWKTDYFVIHGHITQFIELFLSGFTYGGQKRSYIHNYLMNF
ncbi:uncharacterized protein LOC126846874 isoform X2 [Adelges cooleyi]|uniref:uncharacterized protein LOC126846874 isoform X2 n=1 Tax=Adelges cooleyi TaxID=133065 RepID=UPI00217F9925|nr:uncharacterized protein LOC126846874 isoform X2 [Adelges cooleyi]